MFWKTTLASAIIGTWIFNGSRGSLLPTTAYQAAWNQPVITFLMPRLPETVLRRLAARLLIPLELWATLTAGSFPNGPPKEGDSKRRSRAREGSLRPSELAADPLCPGAGLARSPSCSASGEARGLSSSGRLW